MRKSGDISGIFKNLPSLSSPFAPRKELAGCGSSFQLFGLARGMDEDGRSWMVASMV
ncbi:MAG: hypothetical protein K9I74_11840 [Bacteroidales bacterium]|nr:hypothetical protein [Bacteroidales bacterium]